MVHVPYQICFKGDLIRKAEVLPEVPWKITDKTKNLGTVGICMETIDRDHEGILDERFSAGEYFKLVQQGVDFIQKIQTDVPKDADPIEVFASGFAEFLSTLGVDPYDYATLRTLAKKETFNCETSAVLAYDIAHQLGFQDIKLITVPWHMLLKIEGLFFETTNDTLRTEAEYRAEYPSGRYEHTKETCTALFLHNRAISLLDLRRYEEALLDLNKAIEISPFESSLYFNRSGTLVFLDKSREVLGDLAKTIELNPRNSKAYRLRGHILSTYFKNQEDAIIDLNKAIELDPIDAFAYRLRADCFQKLGKDSEALLDFTTAINLDSEDTHSKDAREDILRRQKNPLYRAKASWRSMEEMLQAMLSEFTEL